MTSKNPAPPPEHKVGGEPPADPGASGYLHAEEADPSGRPHKHPLAAAYADLSEQLRVCAAPYNRGRYDQRLIEAARVQIDLGFLAAREAFAKAGEVVE
jgi:hypothetical protein